MTWAHNLCEEVVRPDGQNVFLPAKWHKGVLLIPVSGREACVWRRGGEEQDDEKGVSTSRNVL